MSSHDQPPTEHDNPASVASESEEDFYTENGFVVFTASFLRRRGYCCESGCRHCPYRQPIEPAPRP